jgi:hypothetical protein
MSFLFGALLIMVSVLGGGLDIKELKIPTVGTTSRILSAIVGVVFVIVGLSPSYNLSPLEGQPRSVHEAATLAPLGTAIDQQKDSELTTPRTAQEQRHECWELLYKNGNVTSFCISENGSVNREVIFPNQQENSPPTTCNSTGTSDNKGETLYLSLNLGICDNERILGAINESCVRHATSLVCVNETDNTTDTFKLKIQ